MTTYFTCADVKLVEASGEEFNTLVKSGTLTITGPPAAIEVDGNPVALNKSAREPFKRIGRDFKFATNDVMAYYYVSLPGGLEDSVYNRFEELLSLSVAGKPLTLPGLAEKAAAAAKAAADAAATAAKAAASKAEAAASSVAAKASEAAAKVESEVAGAAAPAADGAKAGAGNFFGALKELGQKAAEDTMAMAAALKAKAEHDMASLQNKPAHEGAERQPPARRRRWARGRPRVG